MKFQMAQSSALPPLPRVDLMDPSVEPTDEELELLMKHVGRNAEEAWERTYAAFMEDLGVSIAKSVASRAAKIRRQKAGISR